MGLPLPRTVADVGPGGPLVTAMGGINALTNALYDTNINKTKAEYAPLTTQAEAASKLAYANLVNPQYIAKIMGNPQFMANLSEQQKNMLKDLAFNAGVRNQGFVGNPLSQGNGNAFNQAAPTPNHSGIGQPSTNSLSGWLKDAFKGMLGQKPSQNPFAQQPSGMPQGQPQEQPAPIQQSNPYEHRPKDGVRLEGEQWYNAKGEPVYEEEETTPDGSMKLELTKDIPAKTYAEKAGEFQGTIEQRKQEGKYRADALKAIGDSQLGLSHSGAVLDRMTGIIKNPTFWNMRNKIPAFQSKQLDYLKAMGTPEEKELIGDFLSTGESFIASTVQGFSGKPLVREFDLAQRQKITPHDTVESAIGKLRSARSLHDIAEKKNQIVSELLEKGYNEADAVKKANKMVDVSAIEKATDDLLERKIEIKNSKTGEKKMVTVKEARKLGVPNV